MKDTIYLICSKEKVEGMRKSIVDMRKGNILVKLKVEVEPKAFGPPTIEKEIYVEDWIKGVDLQDVEFKQNIITKEEASIIRKRRLDKMKEILEKEGYEIKEPAEQEIKLKKVA